MNAELSSQRLPALRAFKKEVATATSSTGEEGRMERMGLATCTGPSRTGVPTRVAESEVGAERMNCARGATSKTLKGLQR
jgi:hypothetical protein